MPKALRHVNFFLLPLVFNNNGAAWNPSKHEPNSLFSKVSNLVNNSLKLPFSFVWCFFRVQRRTWHDFFMFHSLAFISLLTFGLCSSWSHQDSVSKNILFFMLTDLKQQLVGFYTRTLKTQLQITILLDACATSHILVSDYVIFVCIWEHGLFWTYM